MYLCVLVVTIQLQYTWLSSSLSFCLLAEKLLPFSYSQSSSIAIYTLGVVANITIAMHKSGACESVELVEAVKMVTEVCLLSDFGEMEDTSLFKVDECILFSLCIAIALAHRDTTALVVLGTCLFL